MSSIIKVNTVQDTDGNNIINENANTITIGASGDTISIPSGATLANNGTATGFASIAWQSSIVTAATLTAEAGKGYWIDTTSNACTITLPGSASVGDQIIFTDYARNWATNAVTINQNSLKFQGFTSPNPVYNTNGQSVDIVYSGATKGWIPNSDDDVTNETPQFDGTTSFLVVAGGGSGGYDQGGAGGAGGYRSSYNSEASGGGGSAESALTLTQGTTYTITVGAGGAAVTSTPSIGLNGVDSSISGSDITDITSVGGGGGGQGSPNAGLAGGSGGGGSGGGAGNPGGAGTANQGFAGGASYISPGNPGEDSGGGGGAGQAGNNPVVSGGDGVASTITGSSVTRGGGGGGNDYGNNNSRAGGAGGGGAGGTTTPGNAASPGTANTGGGGGAGSGNPPSDSGAGGSGVVILRVLTADYSGTTTGSPTVTTDGTDTILTFNASGSYTP